MEESDSKSEDAARIGVGAAIGATRGKPAEGRVETRISFRLDQPVTLTERLAASGRN